MQIIVSMEDATEVVVEKEITLYGLINSFDGLKEANQKEFHIQAEGYFEDKGKARIRGVKPSRDSSEAAQYTMTLKSRPNENGELIEATIAVDEVFAKNFVSIACKNYIEKTRYTFYPKEEFSSVKLNGVEYKYPSSILKVELDVFNDKSGVLNSYCKIDIETQEFENYFKENHPELMDEIKTLKGSIDLSTLAPQITGIKNPKLDADKEFISALWDKFNIAI